ncbi:MAG: hypothetical protein Q9184_006478, partial [Pyrenodesmia sp. 2 TL-2023]
KPIFQAPTSQAGAPQLPSVAQHEESSKSRAPVEESLFVEPATAAGKDDFNILGAADQTTLESPYLFVDTLPPEISELHAYQDYRAKMDTMVKEFMESTWEARDDEEAASAFNSAFTEFFDPEQAENGAQASSATQNTGDEEPFVDDPDDDEASFYSDEEERISGEQLLSEILSTSTDALVMDPAVSTFLESQWTPEDEAYVSDDFKKSWFAYEGLDAGGAEILSSGFAVSHNVPVIFVAAGGREARLIENRVLSYFALVPTLVEMDYLSLKFLNRDCDHNKSDDRQLRKPAPPSSPLSATAQSPTSIRTTNSTNSTSRLPNDDPLPTSFAALEGHLNHHASQLQQLADRVETINEWIDLDNIVLSRLIRDEHKRVDELLAAERSASKPSTPSVDHNPGGVVHFALGPISPTSGLPLMPQSPPPTTTTAGTEKGLGLMKVQMAKRSASMGDVPRSSPPPTPSLPQKIKTDAQRKEEAVAAHGGIREAQERIRSLKKTRKEIEKAVVWQREEFWRVEACMGKKKEGGKNRESVLSGSGKENVGEVKGEEGGEGALQVVGEEGKGRSWRKGLPSQREWEELFSYS